MFGDNFRIFFKVVRLKYKSINKKFGVDKKNPQYAQRYSSHLALTNI